MIALPDRPRKGLLAARTQVPRPVDATYPARRRLTNTSVKIIKPPPLRPVHAPENCEKEASKGPVRESSRFLSPPAPRGLSGPGPVLHTVQSPNVSGRLAPAFFFFSSPPPRSERGGGGGGE